MCRSNSSVGTLRRSVVRGDIPSFVANSDFPGASEWPEFGGAYAAPGDLSRLEKGGGQSAPQTPHIQGFRNPPDKKIVSAPNITTRSNGTLSRLKSTAETNNSASTRILATLVIVVINSSLRSRHGSIAVSHCCQLHTFHPGPNEPRPSHPCLVHFF
jgi:hypothetical protein